MSDFNPDVEFLGFKVAAGKSFALAGNIPPDNPSITHRPHITNVALGPAPRPGRHTIFAEGNGMKAVVGTLEMGRCEQFQVDFVARDIVFTHTGKSDVYLTGYNTTSGPYTDDMSDEDEDDEDEDDDDDDDAPEGIPLQQSRLMSSAKALAKQQALLIGDASKDDEDDSEDDDGDEEEDDEDSDDEETPANRAKGIATLKKALTAAPINGQDFSDMDDDDMEDDEEDDDEEDDDEEDDEDGSPVIPGLDDDDSSEDDDEDGDEADLVQALQAAGAKRAAPKVTPQPAKKAKMTAAASKAAPATASAAASKAPTASPASQPGLTGPAAAQWLSALKAYLTQGGGETDMSKLGGVKKPEGVAKGQKLKAFILQHPKTFAIDGNSVKLLK